MVNNTGLLNIIIFQTPNIRILVFERIPALYFITLQCRHCERWCDKVANNTETSLTHNHLFTGECVHSFRVASNSWSIIVLSLLLHTGPAKWWTTNCRFWFFIRWNSDCFVNVFVIFSINVMSFACGNLLSSSIIAYMPTVCKVNRIWDVKELNNDKIIIW